MTDALAWIQDNIQWALSLGGLVAGVIVGLTGMGGAALVTPMLVLLFGVNPATAVSSDVVASAIIDDTIGWIIMSITFGLILHGNVDVTSVGQSAAGVMIANQNSGFASLIQQSVNVQANLSVGH